MLITVDSESTLYYQPRTCVDLDRIVKYKMSGAIQCTQQP